MDGVSTSLSVAHGVRRRLEASLFCGGVKMSRLITIPGHDGRSLRSRQKDKVSMTFDSLRDFLAALDDNGQLLRITNECQISDAPGVLAWPVDTAQEKPWDRRVST